MTYELNRTENAMFDEYYEGIIENRRRVICILDDYCVRYMVFTYSRAGWKKVSCREYGNAPKSKALCLANATKALNK